MQFTPAQNDAIRLEGDSLIVSAAAGSGKTAVLTERVIRRLCDEKSPCDADRLMILTFTNAAAAEMRSRITKRLEQLQRESPENEHIRHQLMLMPGAKICTIHSACLDIIQKGFDIIGIDPQFSVADTQRDKIIYRSVRDEFVEQLYERAKDDEKAQSVINYFARGKDDRALIKALDAGTEFLSNLPMPEKAIEQCCECENRIFDGNLGAALKQHLRSEILDIAEGMHRISELADEYGFDDLKQLYESESNDIECMATLLHDYEKIRALVTGFNFGRTPSIRQGDDEVARKWCTESRKKLKGRLEKLADDYLYADEKTIVLERAHDVKTVRAFLGICLELKNAAANERTRLRILNFNDIENYALKLLVADYDGENIIKTKFASELSKQIEEIIVDEYQDCNLAQELIFTALSNNGKNIFTVGDIKQSIYGFRNADPSIFLARSKRASSPEADRLNKPSFVNLNLNFRSHKRILDFVNAVFEPIMLDKNCGIEYKDGHRLEKSVLYDASDCAGVEIAMLVSDGVKPGAKTRLDCEAEYVAKKIKSIIGTLPVYDAKAGRERTARASDIAILMRSVKGNILPFEKALTKAGVAYVNSSPSDSFLETPEIQTAIAFLQVLDNPYDDIPLVALMYSNVFGFSADKLGEIRAKDKSCTFFDAVKEYAKTDLQCANFISCIDDLRALSLTTDVCGIINSIYEKTGMLIRAQSADERANLTMFADIASDFESTRYRGIFAFIKYIEKMMDTDGVIPGAKLKKSADCVNIMTIHGSKGLEFPIVFLVCAANKLTIDVPCQIALNPKLGASGKIFDDNLHRSFSPLSRNIITAYNERAQRNEYMRLLYVALTRACSYLYITASPDVFKADDIIHKAYAAGGNPGIHDIYSEQTFFKMLMFSLINSPCINPFLSFAGLKKNPGSPDNLFHVVIQDVCLQSDTQGEAVPSEQKLQSLDPDFVKQKLIREYRYKSSVGIPAKLSVSEIKQSKIDGVTAANFEKTVSHRKPAFMQKGASGADIGNATHALLQYCDFEKITDMPSLNAEISRLVSDKFVLESDAQLVDKDKILRFLNTDIMKKLTALHTCNKEYRFLITLPAGEIMETDADEQIIVQGIIDCWYVSNGKAVILDYKTDYVQSQDELIKRYHTQLDLYETALKLVHGIDTSHKYIYSFCLEEFIEIK